MAVHRHLELRYIVAGMGIQLTAVACNNCGASLAIDDETRFVACTHCGSQLAVRREQGAAFTKTLLQISAHTSSMATNLEYLRLQNEIDELDREWKLWVETKVPNTSHLMPMTSFGACFLVAFAAVIGAVVAALLLRFPIGVPKGIVAVIGVGIPSFAAIFAAMGRSHATYCAKLKTAFAKREADYQWKRRQLREHMQKLQ